MPVVNQKADEQGRVLVVAGGPVSSTWRPHGEVFADAPERYRDDLRRGGQHMAPEDDMLRLYVSRLWAEDWDSDSDAVYDTR